MVSLVLNTAAHESRLKPHRRVSAERLRIGARLTLIFKFRAIKCTHLLAPSKSRLGSLMKKCPMIHSECPLFWLCSIICTLNAFWKFFWVHSISYHSQQDATAASSYPFCALVS